MVGGAIVLALFVHLARRDGLGEDILAAPTGVVAATPLHRASVTFSLPVTPVHHSGEVALRMTMSESRSASAVTLRVEDRAGVTVGTCSFPAFSFRDADTLRCSIRDLAAAKRVEVRVQPRDSRVGVLTAPDAAGLLVVPRSTSRLGKMETIIERIGAKHPLPFSPWIVPLGTWFWLAALTYLGLLALRRSDID